MKRWFTDKELRKALFNQVGVILTAAGILAGIVLFYSKQKVAGLLFILMALWIMRTINED